MVRGLLTAPFDGSRLSGSRPPSLQQPVHVADRLTLSVLHDVRVHVHGDADLTVPEDLHHDAGRDSGRREESRRAVPSVMEPDDAKARSTDCPTRRKLTGP